MIEYLKTLCKVEERNFNTIFGTFQGWIALLSSSSRSRSWTSIGDLVATI
jgi:hypothetical protein